MASFGVSVELTGVAVAVVVDEGSSLVVDSSPGSIDGSAFVSPDAGFTESLAFVGLVSGSVSNFISGFVSGSFADSVVNSVIGAVADVIFKLASLHFSPSHEIQSGGLQTFRSPQPLTILVKPSSATHLRKFKFNF